MLKSTDPEFKWEKAQEYFADDRCIQSLPLLQELIGLFRGTERMEDVYFMYAEAHLCVQDWFMGRYSMRNLPRRFPILTAPKKQSFAQHSAATGYLPDQSSIKARLPVAMDELQLFLDRYPTTHLRDSCNNMIFKLRGKLETKAWKGAELYFTTSKFQSASKALQQFIDEWPASQYAEEAQFLILKSQFLYAEQSTSRRQSERYADAIESYFTFAARFPESALLNEAEQFHRKSRAGLEKASTEQR